VFGIELELGSSKSGVRSPQSAIGIEFEFD